MSSIPYNYGKYIDDKVSMTNNGHVDASKQINSPASAGSRGLAKTTQFTNNPTQMKMGESITMEDMKTLINRIDGLNVPTNEAPKDSDIDYAKLMLQISAMKDKIAELPIDDDRKTSALTALGQVEDDLSMDESAVQEDDDESYGYEWECANCGTENEFEMSPQERAEYIKNWEEDNQDLVADGETGLDALNNLLDTGAESGMHYGEKCMKCGTVAANPYQSFPEADEMTFEDDDAFFEAFGYLGFPEDENELFDAEYRGRKVPLNKPMRGDVKKFKVYVKDPKTGNVKKVNFGHGGSSARKAGQKTMKIRKSNPKARKSFRARHNCANPGPKTKARYWSCRKW